MTDIQSIGSDFQENFKKNQVFSKIDRISRSNFKLESSYIENLDNEKKIYKKDIEIFISIHDDVSCFYGNVIMALLNSSIKENFGKEIHENIEEYSKYVRKIMISKWELEYLKISNLYEKKYYLDILLKKSII